MCMCIILPKLAHVSLIVFPYFVYLLPHQFVVLSVQLGSVTVVHSQLSGNCVRETISLLSM